MRLKTDIEESIRDSNCYNIIHRFIVLALTLSTRRLECLDLRPDPKPRSGEVPPPNPTWCQYICIALPRVGHQSVVKGSKVYEIRHVDDEEGDNGEEHFPVYFVYDNSWDEEFKVELSHRHCGCGQFQENGYPCVHALFVLHQKNMLDDVESYIDEGYLCKNVAKTCLILPVGWIDKLQGLKEWKRVS